MKASEVLRRYAAGERHFQRANLRGQSFRGKDLSGADFSEANIRGTNFTNANLRNAKFIKAKAGMQSQWKIFFVIILWLFSIFVGISSVLTDSFVELIFHSRVNAS